MMKNRKRLLIIFYRNPELGKVKNRLAVTVGEERALALYLLMAAHARNVTLTLSVDRVVYYSEFIDTEDSWLNQDFTKRLQHGDGLGEKMKHAFEESFRSGYESVCIIGTDCFELTSEILDNAFASLETNDAVIGPAADGGYYLLGMNGYIPEFFNHKTWSTSSVCADTIDDFKRFRLHYQVLPTLHDVDNESDLPPHLR
jgi:rSAM/selenodomain-associated transferase 1